MAEYIEREAAKRIIDDIDTWSSGWREYAKLQMDSLPAADAIEELEEKCQALAETLYAYEHPWIPVTERLPKCERGTEVGNIEWISCGKVYAGCFGRGGRYRDAYFRTWTDGTEGIDAKDADYWRPIQIPEPPKEET